MRHLTLVILFSLFALSMKAQKFSIEANYVSPVGDNFLNASYYGVAEIGLKYRFINLGIARIGGSLKGSTYLGNSDLTSLVGFNAQTFFIQPKIFIEMGEIPFTKIHPFVEFGYDYMVFRAPDAGGNLTEGILDTRDGGSLEAGIMYDIVERLFIQVMYDFTRLRQPEGTIIVDNPYNRNLSRIKAGIGIRI